MIKWLGIYVNISSPHNSNYVVNTSKKDVADR